MEGSGAGCDRESSAHGVMNVQGLVDGNCKSGRPISHANFNSLTHRDMQSEWERDCVSSKLHTVVGNLRYYE